MRKDAREAVYKLLFEYTFTHTVNERTLLMFCGSANITESDAEYIRETIAGISAEFDALTGLIMQYAHGYSSPDRLNRADYAALLLGSYELLHTSQDVPVAVAINEAVNLSKEFGGEKSSGFVNGILSGVNKNK